MNTSPATGFRLRGWNPESDAESHVLVGFTTDYAVEQHARTGTLPITTVASPAEMTYLIHVTELGEEELAGVVSITYADVALSTIYVAPAYRRRGICGTLLDTFQRKRQETELPFAVVPPVTPDLLALMNARGIGTTEDLAEPTAAQRADDAESLAEFLDAAQAQTRSVDQVCAQTHGYPSACVHCVYGSAHRWAAEQVTRRRAELA